MCFVKPKISWILPYFKREEPEQENSHNQSKAKPNSNCVNNSMPIIWGSLTVSWALPKGLGHFSSSTLCNTHSLSSKFWQAPLCLGCSSWWLSYGPRISKMLGSLVQRSCAFSNSLSWALFRDSSPATQCQASAALHAPFMPLKPAPPGWLIGCQVQIQMQGTTLAVSGAELACADSQETLPGRSHGSDAILFLTATSFSVPVDQHPWSW